MVKSLAGPSGLDENLFTKAWIARKIGRSELFVKRYSKRSNCNDNDKAEAEKPRKQPRGDDDTALGGDHDTSIENRMNIVAKKRGYDLDHIIKNTRIPEIDDRMDVGVWMRKTGWKLRDWKDVMKDDFVQQLHDEIDFSTNQRGIRKIGKPVLKQ